jgi:glycosyltransferase involved in cell wall biosynthesis
MPVGQQPKIVVVTESLLGQWFDGVSLIVRHFIRHLPSDMACEVWSLGAEADAPVLNSKCSFQTLVVPREPRLSWLLRVIGIPAGIKNAENSNKSLKAVCASADAIMIFSSVQSPVTSWIVRSWPEKTLLHLTDCASLHAKRFGNHKYYIRHRLMEWATGRATLSSIVFVSPFDAEVFRKTSRTNSPVVALPLGVDTEQFRPLAHPDHDNIRPFTVLFTGVLSYYPNGRAAHFIARDILPLLPSEMRVIIAGMEPAEELYAVAENNPRLVITGAMPDIERIYGEAHVFLAPMFEGAGMQNKILQALASGLPVITTPICALAFSTLPDAIRICADANAMVAAIKELQSDEIQRQTMAANARKFAVDELSWENRATALLEHAGIRLHKRPQPRPLHINETQAHR